VTGNIIFYKWKADSPKVSFNINPKKKTKCRASTVKVEGSTHSSKWWNIPSLA
jgi:hypothetical protein